MSATYFKKKRKYQYNRSKRCIIDGCNNGAYVKGMCKPCYERKRRRAKGGQKQ